MLKWDAACLRQAGVLRPYSGRKAAAPREIIARLQGREIVVSDCKIANRARAINTTR
jgi:hypothetical protein